MTESGEPFGLYIHIPFCRSKCPYCDFCSFPHPQEETVRAYAAELERRIRAAGREMNCPGDRPVDRPGDRPVDRPVDRPGDRPVDRPGDRPGDRPVDRPVDTVYFGGGTPTVLPTDCVVSLTAAVRESFFLLPDAEYTVECNPATADRAVLSAWRAGGVNRLSIGAQSAQAEELKALGRLHRWSDVERTVRDARAVGIDNINVDFMLGIPHQTPTTLADTLARAVALEPEHLSAYTLMLEEGTPYHRRGRAALGLLPDEEEAEEAAADLWEQASATLRAAGYEHYEISNYARPGRRSRHNLHTWQCHDYLGLGLAAHSCMEGVRFGQSRDLAGFLAGADITDFRTPLSPADREAECIMLALRLSDGIDDADFAARFGHGFQATYGERCAPFVRAGLMVWEGGRCRLTERGFLVSNAVIGAIL